MFKIPDGYIQSQLADITKQKNLEIFNGFLAHRGAQSFAPENTLKAIRYAGEYGYGWVEIDAQPTSDSIWILMHNSTVDATTDGTGAVNSLTYSAISAMNIDVGFIESGEVLHPPKLDDVLDECVKYGLGVNIDGGKFTLNEANITTIYAKLKERGLLEKSFLTISSGSAERQLSYSLYPDLRIGWVTTVENFANDLIEAQSYKYNVILAVLGTNVTEDYVQLCKDNGIPMFGYNVHTINDVYACVNKGCSMIETNTILSGGVL